MSSGFWQGRKVLVTGHTGFKGSWLSIWLQGLGAETVGYALPVQTEPSLFELARLADHMRSIEGDVRDLEHLSRVIGEERPEVVFHLAAQAIVRTGYDDPIETYTTNVIGTANVLEAVRLDPAARAVLVVTSDKCYENLERAEGYTEEDALGGHDPYSSSKACAELVTRSYRDAFFAASEPAVGVATVRAGNVIGGGDWAADRLVPDIMRAFIDGEPLYIRYPEAVRPWQHVLDPLHGYLTLAERLFERGADYAEAWNFAPADATMLSVREMVERFLSLWDEPIEVGLDPGPHPHEHGLLLLDPGKANRRLDWRAKLSHEEAFDWVVEWYRAYRDGDDMRRVTERQIARHRALTVTASG
jgi:CDP-glucose 4,6-dehydratase